ncbi:hypothetical protein TNCV_4020811 [Trichonephila clavipes]|nr:hypothetical protein TNCV_4020811 [Trichonephila clavipes]
MFASCLELQSLWQVPAIATFISICRFKFNLPHLDIETVEELLMTKSLIGRILLKELIVALLEAIYGRRINSFWISSNNILKNFRSLNLAVGKSWSRLLDGQRHVQLSALPRVEDVACFIVITRHDYCKPICLRLAWLIHHSALSLNPCQ